MKRSYLAVGAPALVAAMLIAGCGGGGSSSSTATESEPAAAAESEATAEPASAKEEPTSGSEPFLSKFTKVSNIASTVPSNGDINPYGLVSVPESVGKLKEGQLLISNFNAKEARRRAARAPARRSCRSRPRARSRPSRRSMPKNSPVRVPGASA